MNKSVNSLSSSADSVISILIDRLIARLIKLLIKEAPIIIKLNDKWYHLGTYGRWAFAEFTEVYQIEAEFNKLIDGLTLREYHE
jgi:hypothetical protein